MEKNNQTLNEQIGGRLRELREAKHMSQIAVSIELNIANTTYNRYENGKSSIPFDILVAVCKLFHVTTDFVLTGVKEEFLPERRIRKELITMNQRDKEMVRSFLAAVTDSLER